jgi:hypothetical protein
MSDFGDPTVTDNIEYIANYCYGTSMSGIELRNETLVIERNPNQGG